MALEPNIVTAARSHLRHIGALKPCPTCEETQWDPTDVVMLATLAPTARGVDPTRTVAALLVECGNCGYLLSFNADKIPGLLPKPGGREPN